MEKAYLSGKEKVRGKGRRNLIKKKKKVILFTFFPNWQIWLVRYKFNLWTILSCLIIAIVTDITWWQKQPSWASSFLHFFSSGRCHSFGLTNRSRIQTLQTDFLTKAPRLFHTFSFLSEALCQGWGTPMESYHSPSLQVCPAANNMIENVDLHRVTSAGKHQFFS